jgi:putative endonuclease
MTNRPNGMLYVGVTDDVGRRAWEHRAGLVEGFTKQYGLRRLVFVEYYGDMRAARQRERNMKHWRRSWKVRLIPEQNPYWDDLYHRLAQAIAIGGSLAAPPLPHHRAYGSVHGGSVAASCGSRHRVGRPPAAKKALDRVRRRLRCLAWVQWRTGR